MRRRLVAIPTAMAALLILAATALAGGWADVSATTTSGGTSDGTTTVELTVLQHGVTPVSWPDLTIVARGPDGATVRAEATAQGKEGHYVATMALPAEGTWRLTYESDDLIMEGAPSISIAAPIAAPAPAPLASPAAMDPVFAGLVTLAAGVVILAIALVLLRSRRGDGRERPATVSG